MVQAVLDRKDPWVTLVFKATLGHLDPLDFVANLELREQQDRLDLRVTLEHRGELASLALQVHLDSREQLVIKDQQET